MADGKCITRRGQAAMVPAVKCAICPFPVSRFDPAAGEATFRGLKFSVCGPCRRRYSHALSQIAWSGTRFRFVEKTEIPQPPAIGWTHFTQIYKIVLLLREREQKRQKEVNWMVDNMTRKIVSLKDRAARAMKDTFAVRGDDATVPDDIALLKIKDLLEEIDPDVFRRLLSRKKKRLS